MQLLPYHTFWLLEVCINSQYSLNIEIILNFTLGIIYDVIIEPPSVGSTTDEKGHSRPVTSSNIYLCLESIKIQTACI